MALALDKELDRELRWFYLSLLPSVALLFAIFTTMFERRLQKRVTKPIKDLTVQLKNPR